jgi:hypothetical protein
MEAPAKGAARPVPHTPANDRMFPAKADAVDEAADRPAMFSGVPGKRRLFSFFSN